MPCSFGSDRAVRRQSSASNNAFLPFRRGSPCLHRGDVCHRRGPNHDGHATTPLSGYLHRPTPRASGLACDYRAEFHAHIPLEAGLIANSTAARRVKRSQDRRAVGVYPTRGPLAPPSVFLALIALACFRLEIVRHDAYRCLPQQMR